MKSPLRYPGGKSRAIKQIMPLIPDSIQEYREPFVGGGSVYLAARSRFENSLSRYWINDLNEDVAYFWQAVRDDLPSLVSRVQALHAQFSDGRALYEHLKADGNFESPFERAIRFFIMNRITFSGVMDAGGYSDLAFRQRFTASSIQRLGQLDGYLHNTQISIHDYEEVVCAAGENVFIFLDPPYLSATKSRLYGKKGILHTDFNHQRFAQVMQNCPHRWLITYDNSPEIRALFDFARITEWELQYGMNNFMQSAAAKGKEIFIQNY